MKELISMYKDRLMPIDWDGENIFARYNSAKIILIDHDKTYLSNESKN